MGIAMTKTLGRLDKSQVPVKLGSHLTSIYINETTLAVFSWAQMDQKNLSSLWKLRQLMRLLPKSLQQAAIQNVLSPLIQPLENQHERMVLTLTSMQSVPSA